PFQFQKSELVIVKPFHDKVFKGQDLKKVLEEKQSSQRQKVKSKRRRKEDAIVEIDLHIHKLTSSTKGRTTVVRLNWPVDTAKQRWEHAIAHRIPRLVFIDGVGQAVLTREIGPLCWR